MNKMFKMKNATIEKDDNMLQTNLLDSRPKQVFALTP